MNFLYFLLSTLLLKLVCYYSWLQFAILLHELGHAVVGKLVGLSPEKIQVGTGRSACRFSALGLQWVFGLQPWGGLTYHKECLLPGLRWRGAVMVLAGPASDLFLLSLLVNYWPLIAGLDAYGLQKPMSGTIQFLIMMQVMALLYSLVPHDVVVDGKTLPNDGKQFLGYISGKYTRELRERLAATEDYRKAIARYAPDFQVETSSWIRQLTPEEVGLWQEAESDSEAGNFDSAIEKLETLLRHPKLIGPERAWVLDSMASIAVMKGHDASLNKALAWAREAHALAPNGRTILGTLGGALVQSGAYTEAIEMLTPLTTPENEHVDRTISSIYLAKAWDRQGDPSQAAHWLAMACELGSHDEIRNRIAAELSPEAKAGRA